MNKKNKQRNEEILEMCKRGKTFREIGEIAGITRQRAHQIAFNGLKKEIAEGNKLNYQSALGSKADNLLAKETHKIIGFISKSRKISEIEKKRKNQRKDKINSSLFKIFYFKKLCKSFKNTLEYY